MSRKGEAIEFLGALALLLLLAGHVLQVILLRRTRFWPKVWATIHSADMEVMELDSKTDIMLPCFTFSYVVADKEYSGRFSLFTNGEEEGESVAEKMIERKFELRYNPKTTVDLVHSGQEDDRLRSPTEDGPAYGKSLSERLNRVPGAPSIPAFCGMGGKPLHSSRQQLLTPLTGAKRR